MEKVCPHCPVAHPITKYGKYRDDGQRYQCGGCKRTFIDKPKPKAPGKKLARKGIKSTRGRPEMHDQLKGKVSLSLTSKGVQGLDALAQSKGVSRSELVEQIGRGLIPISHVAGANPD